MNWVVNALIIAFMVVLVVISDHRSDETDARLAVIATETHSALCALKQDVKRRRDNTLEYLARHPGPEPIRGITRQEILRGLDQQEDTLRALRPLDCS